MGTRANIILNDDYGDELCYYKHNDGYPEGVMPTLKAFMGKVKAGQIRDNVGQAGGWIMILDDSVANKDSTDWKASAIEPSTCIHGDIEWLYIVDLSTKTITLYNVESNGKIPLSIYNGIFSRPRRKTKPASKTKPAIVNQDAVTQEDLAATVASLRSALEMVRDSADDTQIEALRAHCANILKNTA